MRIFHVRRSLFFTKCSTANILGYCDATIMLYMYVGGEFICAVECMHLQHRGMVSSETVSFCYACVTQEYITLLAKPKCLLSKRRCASVSAVPAMTRSFSTILSLFHWEVERVGGVRWSWSC